MVLRDHLDQGMVRGDLDGTGGRGRLEVVDHRPDLLQHAGDRAQGPQSIAEGRALGREEEHFTHMEADGAVPGHQGGGVEERHALGQRTPSGGIGQLGEGPLFAGQGQGLGHPDIPTVGPDQADHDMDRRPRDVATAPGLLPHVCHVNRHCWSFTPRQRRRTSDLRFSSPYLRPFRSVPLPLDGPPRGRNAPAGTPGPPGCPDHRRTVRSPTVGGTGPPGDLGI